MNDARVVLLALFALPVVVSIVAGIVGFIRFARAPRRSGQCRPVGMTDEDLERHHGRRKYIYYDELVKEDRGLTAEQWDELYEEALRRNRPGGPWTKL